MFCSHHAQLRESERPARTRSKEYLGVHFQWDGDRGFQSGNALAEYV